jgi:ribonuclease D
VRKLPVLEGWRFEVFGRDALELVEGKLGFGVENGRLKMTRIADEPEPQAEKQAAE